MMPKFNNFILAKPPSIVDLIIEQEKLQLIEWISEGLSINTIRKKAIEKYGWCGATWQNRIKEALKSFRLTKNKEEMIEANFIRLDSIVEKTMMKGENRDAVAAIKAQNNMLGIYEKEDKKSVKITDENQIIEVEF